MPGPKAMNFVSRIFLFTKMPLFLGKNGTFPEVKIVGLTAALLLTLCSCNRVQKQSYAATTIIPTPVPSRDFKSPAYNQGQNSGRVGGNPFSMRSEDSSNQGEGVDGNRLGTWPRQTYIDRPGADRSGWEGDQNLMPPVRSPTSPGTNDNSPGNPFGTGGRPLAP